MHFEKLFTNASDIPQKIRVIQAVISSLEDFESENANNAAFRTWSGIAAVFSSTLTLSGVSAVNPILGLVLATASSISAVGCVANNIYSHFQDSGKLSTARKLKAALKSDTPINWATLWECCGTEIFLQALAECCRGELDPNSQLPKLRSAEGKGAMAVALDYLAAVHGCDRTTVISHLQAIKAGNKSTLPSLPSAPTVLQPITPAVQPVLPIAPLQSPTAPPINLGDIAYKILDSLVLQADKGTLGGAIILAAPGAGKTTFLGTAWGRLKQRFGDKFKSLAIVVKSSDLDAFKACSDKAFSVKDSAVFAAVEIIKFINHSMSPDGNVKRLFLDDFLTLISKLETATKGLYYNVANDVIYPNSQAKKDDFDAVPLWDCLLDSLNECWLVGREYNLCLWVSSHSSNVDALPFAKSRDARAVGDLIFLARDDKREFIEQALNNSNLIASGDRRNELKATLASTNSPQPWILANFDNWSLGIVPASIRAEYESFRVLWDGQKPLPIEDLVDNRVNNDIERLNRIYQMESAKEPTMNTQKLQSFDLSAQEKVVIQIIESALALPISFDSIRKSRKWSNGITKAELLGILETLKTKKLVVGDESTGYDFT